MPFTNGSQPMKSTSRMGPRLGGQMLAAAEADLEPGLGAVGRPAKHAPPDGSSERHPQGGSRSGPARLPGAQLLAFPAPEKGAGAFGPASHRSDIGLL